MKTKIIDAHTHIGYFPTLLTAKRNLLKSMRNENISLTLFSVDASEFENEDPNSKIPSNPLIKMSQIEVNQIGVDFCKNHPNLLRCLIWIKPHFEKNIEELQSFYDKNKKFIKGLKIHPCLSKLRMTDKRIVPYIQFAERNNLPILVHTAKDEYSHIRYLETVAKKYPNVTFIAAHIQLCSDNKYGIEVIKRNPNIYGDTAWVSPKSMLLCKEKDILDKIIFGTDCPIDGLNTYPNLYYQTLFKNTINLTDSEWKNLMFNTAKKVYKL